MLERNKRAAIFGHEKDNGFKNRPRSSCSCGEVGDGREDPTSQLHKFWEGKVVEENRDFLEWGSGILGGGTRFGGVVLAAAVLALPAGFFLDFPAASLGAAVNLG